MYKLLYLLVVGFVIAGCGGDGGSGSEGAAASGSDHGNAAGKKALFAVWMAGSDLEENGSNFATYDLLEMANGYSALSLSKKSKTDFLIAFGGSRKVNWSGVKYADAHCLVKDAADGVFGNDTCYLHVDKEADMGAQRSLENFLNTIDGTKSNYDRKDLVFWNHGAAYGGVCFDSNHGGDQLSISELKSAFETVGIHFDIIGMDACLMANLEVAESIRKAADYLVASEETEPSHGWDFEKVIAAIGNSDIKDSVWIGTQMVKSYIHSEKHASTFNKTLSLIDLSKVKEVDEKLENVLDKIDGEIDFDAIIKASAGSEQYSKDKDTGFGMSMDLKGFVNRLKTYRTDISNDFASLEKSIDSLIIYSEADSMKKDSSGITIFQLHRFDKWSRYKQETAGSKLKEWKNTIAKVLSFGLKDDKAPVVSNEKPCIQSGTEGYCMTIKDNISVESVLAADFLPFGDDYLFLGAGLVNPVDTDNYFLPKSSGYWLWFCSDPSEQRCIFPSAFNFEPVTGDTVVYSSFANINGKDAIFNMQVNNATNDIDAWYVFEDASGVPSKDQYRLKKGDNLLFYYNIVSDNDYAWQEGDKITFTSDPVMSIKPFNADNYYIMIALDFKGNAGFSQPHSRLGGI